MKLEIDLNVEERVYLSVHISADIKKRQKELDERREVWSKLPGYDKVIKKYEDDILMLEGLESNYIKEYESK